MTSSPEGQDGQGRTTDNYNKCANNSDQIITSLQPCRQSQVFKTIKTTIRIVFVPPVTNNVKLDSLKRSDCARSPSVENWTEEEGGGRGKEGEGGGRRGKEGGLDYILMENILNGKMY